MIVFLLDLVGKIKILVIENKWFCKGLNSGKWQVNTSIFDLEQKSLVMQQFSAWGVRSPGGTQAAQVRLR